jgi:hypothetical protein
VKIMDDIKDELLGGRKACIAPLSVKEDLDFKPLENLTEYRIRLMYQIIGYCNPKDLHHLKENFISQLRLELYGELQNMVLNLSRAIFEDDEFTVRELINKLDNEVFGR